MPNNVEKMTKKFVRDEERLVKYEWNHYKTFLIALVIILTLESYVTGSLRTFLEGLGQYEYLGAFLGGFFYTYGMTTVFAVAVLLVLADSLNPLIVALIGAFGSVLSEYTIYTFIRKGTEKMIKENKNINISKIAGNKFLKKISPILAGFIIASPLPDELAAALLGMECCDVKKFLLITFVFNFIGILFIVGIGRLF
jgi:hypothetical protein